MKGRAWVFAAMLAIVCGSAKAAFVNGVEDFNGTSVDANTWVPFFFGNGAATVSNGYLNLSGQYTLATRSLTLGVGDTVSARVMLTARSSFGTVVHLGLTATPTDPVSGQNIYDELVNTIQGDNDYIVFAGNNNGASSVASAIISNDLTLPTFNGRSVFSLPHLPAPEDIGFLGVGVFRRGEPNHRLRRSRSPSIDPQLKLASYWAGLW